VAQGQRLRLRPFSDDFRPGGNQVSGTNRTIRYDGVSTYASRLIFTQTITEFVAGNPLDETSWMPVAWAEEPVTEVWV
jgi:hypothetical protein